MGIWESEMGSSVRGERATNEEDLKKKKLESMGNRRCSGWGEVTVRDGGLVDVRNTIAQATVLLMGPKQN